MIDYYLYYVFIAFLFSVLFAYKNESMYSDLKKPAYYFQIIIRLIGLIIGYIAIYTAGGLFGLDLNVSVHAFVFLLANSIITPFLLKNNILSFFMYFLWLIVAFGGFFISNNLFVFYSIPIILKAIFLFVFWFATFTDMDERSIYTIPSVFLLIAGLAGSFYGVFAHITFYESILCTSSTVVIFTAISLLSKRILGKVGFGMGDVILLVAISPYLGFLWLWTGISIACCTGSIYLTAKRIFDRKKDCAIPFVPFLWAGVCLAARIVIQ
jgi:prepilin signal peptidase PulO-like enzyme (type II secretory pathway)